MTEHYDYDLVVIGGGSGGLVAAQQAAKLGARVCLFDYVEPSPKGTTWGLGGTCVNVGCIPKKLMHQASLLGESQNDFSDFGWNTWNDLKHDWERLVENVTNHISSLNWGYKNRLKSSQVTYVNAEASFLDPHTIQYRERIKVAFSWAEQEKQMTAKHVIVAIGGRPKYPDILGAELAISSDDLFRLERPPGKTLVVGASYVALECAGFLGGLGYPTTVMIRSIPLRGFDQDMAEKVVTYMSEKQICQFLRETIPIQMEKAEDGKILVKYKKTTSSEILTEVYDTVLFAIGRQINSESLHLEGLETVSNGKIPVDSNHQSRVDNVYVIGDAVENSLELTPIAMMEGRQVANHLFSVENREDIIAKPTYTPSAVFTPLEYGFVGLSNEEALAKYGEEGCETYHSYFTPLEWRLSERGDNYCYCKIIVEKASDLVVGLHILSPNAGEIVSGFSVALNMGLKRQVLLDNLAIHPTVSEELFKLEISLSSGEDPTNQGC